MGTSFEEQSSSIFLSTEQMLEMIIISHIEFANGTWSIDSETLHITGTILQEIISSSLLKIESLFARIASSFLWK